MAPPFASVWFDCDSTLSAIEGVDELLQNAPAALRNEIASLTERAMNGVLPLAQVYEARLRLLAPRREQVERIGPLYVAKLLPDARDVVAALQHVGKQVGIVSGGLLAPVLHVAEHLGIPAANVYAVALTFDAAGAYVDFDRASPLARNGGKVDVLKALPGGFHPLAFVGDGATDLEAQGHVARFIGFGGVAVRPVVRARAEVFVSEPRLAAVLKHVLTADELWRLRAEPRFAPLLSPPGP
jgi:phosphoserine phosphatase